MSHLNSPRLTQESSLKKKPVLCYVTDRRGLAPAAARDSNTALLDRIQVLAQAGVDWIQLRERDLPGRTLGALTRSALRCLPAPPNAAVPCTTRLLVNDRFDVALAERAGGVHLGENSLPVSEVKRLLASRPSPPASAAAFLIGVSCHSLPGAQSAGHAGADYIFFGPVFATPSKAAFGAPQGLTRLAQVCASLKIPVLAIGGITLETAAACWDAGASGIAAIRLFQDATDPAAVVAALRQTMS